MTGERQEEGPNGVLSTAMEIVSLANSDVSCRSDSTLPVERDTAVFFLRAGRIHGGRTELTINSWERVGLSSGICVTTSTIRFGETISTHELTPAKLFHHIAGALAAYVTITEPPQKTHARS